MSYFGDESHQAINCTSTNNQTHNNQGKIHKNNPNTNKLALVRKPQKPNLVHL